VTAAPLVLDGSELYDVAERFGGDVEQVRRDHVISHVLAALSARSRGDFVFFGGTALSRTWLPDVRLSEDVDLMVRSRRDAGRALREAVDKDIAPRASVAWSKDPAESRDAEDLFLDVGDDVTIRFQLVDTAGRPPWPTVERDIVQRYSDAPRARLIVPTVESAAAMKLSAWFDRRAPRDLYDMWALADSGLITCGALRLFTKLGPSARPPGAWVFQSAPSRREWFAQLAHQTDLRVGPDEALEAVASAWYEAEVAMRTQA